MKAILIFALVTLFASTAAIAATNQYFETRTTVTQLPIHISIQKNNKFSSPLYKNLQANYPKNSNSSYTFKPMNNGELFQNSVVRLQEYYLNLPVFNAELIAHKSKDNDLFFTGNIVFNIEKDISSIIPSMSSIDAIKIIESKLEKQSVTNVNVILNQLLIYLPSNQASTHAGLAYQLTAHYQRGFESVIETFIVDANSGAILNYHYNLQIRHNISRSSNPAVSMPPILMSDPSLIKGSGPGGFIYSQKKDVTGMPASRYYFGQGQGSYGFTAFGISYENKHCIYTTPNFFLSQANKQDFSVSVYTKAKYPAFNYSCETPMDAINLNDGGLAPQNGAISPNNNVFGYMQLVYKMYQEDYKIEKPFNGNQQYIYTHMNAQGVAGYSPPEYSNGKLYYLPQFFFGQGIPPFMPFVSAVTIAHELTHAVTYYQAPLDGSDDAAALNEFFSDMMGIAFRLYLEKHFSWFQFDHKQLWTIGNREAVDNSAERYLYNPLLNGSSIINVHDIEEAFGLKVQRIDDISKAQIPNEYTRFMYVFKLPNNSYVFTTYGADKIIVPTGSKLDADLNQISDNKFTSQLVMLEQDLSSIKTQMVALLKEKYPKVEPPIDIHAMAGIYSAIFYNLSNNYQSDGLTPENVIKLMFTAHMKYWTRSTSFQQAAYGVLNAAQDLDFNTQQTQDIIKEFSKAGINVNKC